MEIQGAKLSRGELVVAGALAGVLSKSSTAPLDRIRILFQVNRKRPFTIHGCFEMGIRIVQREGVLGLWSGNTAVVLRVMPYAGLQFASFDQYRSALEGTLGKQHPLGVRFCAGALAGVTATSLTYPLDLLRAQMAVSESSLHLGPRHASYADAATYIVRNDGFCALFRGLQPTLMGIVPNAGMSFMVFETLKPWMQRKLGIASEHDLPMAWRLAAGGVAGCVAQVASYPLHIVRRRMQVQGIVSADHRYSTVSGALLTILRTEGFVKGLYKGSSLTLLKGPLAAAVGFTANDFLKGIFARAHADFEKCPPPGRPLRPEVEHELPRPTGLGNTWLEHFMSGGAAGAVAKTLIAPADRVKILYQTDTLRVFGWRQAARTFAKIYEATGVAGLWRGHCATLVRVVPYSATAFMTFDSYRQSLCQLDVLDKVTTRFVAGALAGATATTLTYPLDLLRARMAAHWDVKPRYPNYVVAVETLVKEEGATALFTGLRPTLLGIMPYAGLTFMTYETLKVQLSHGLALDSPKDLSTGTRLAAGAFAGVCAQTATYPLDIIRRRMQVHPYLYRNEWHALKTIFATEGVVGFFKGVTMNWVKGPIAVGVSFTVNDILRSRLGGR